LIDQNGAELIDTSKLYVDFDEAMKTKEGMKQISYTRLKRIKNWQTSEIGVVQAYYKKLLRPNDYKWINSMILTVVLFVTLTIVLYISQGAAGVMKSSTVIYAAILIFVGSSVVY